MRKTQIHLEEVTRVAHLALALAAGGAVCAMAAALVVGLPVAAALAVGGLAFGGGAASAGFGLAATLATIGWGARRSPSMSSAPGGPTLRVPQTR